MKHQKVERKREINVVNSFCAKRVAIVLDSEGMQEESALLAVGATKVKDK